MCGWCVERIMLVNEIKGLFPPTDIRRDSMQGFLYLREATNFEEAFEQMKQSIIDGNITSSGCSTENIILVRALEMCVGLGFSSASYQKLLNEPLFRCLIEKACGIEWEYKFAQATKGLPVMPLGVLYSADTFLKGNHAWESLRTDQLLSACRSLLDDYPACSLKGKEGLRIKNIRQGTEETRVFDPTEYIYEDRHERLHILLRALFFSVITIGKLKRDKNILRELAISRYCSGSDFIANDLWLQRIAALKLYDLLGFDGFIQYFQDFRTTIFYYIGLKRGYTQAQKKILLEAARQHPEVAFPEDPMIIEEWDLGGKKQSQHTNPSVAGRNLINE